MTDDGVLEPGYKDIGLSRDQWTRRDHNIELNRLLAEELDNLDDCIPQNQESPSVVSDIPTVY